MTKLIMQYESGGGYDCNSCTTVCAFEYESAEALLCNFEDKLKEQLNIRIEYFKSESIEYKDVNRFEFLGYEFDLGDFLYGENHIELPEVFTLEEWFTFKLGEKNVS